MVTTSPLRPRPEDFLELVQKGKRGRLKLYIGFAAGVGKTYRMLEEAHSLRKRGVDVVVGFVESHGRAETEALVEGLEVIPRRQVEYRGVMIDEMSLNKILKRNPAVALVDELAHTNVPGSHNKKRYQDVLELLDAGINVIAALNVQHLDSLNDLVGRVTGVVVRETVPDSFLKRADQVVNLDLAVEDLQERLRTGKIYAADKIPWALEHFFTEENLTHLRELALREVAESVERSSFEFSLSGHHDVGSSCRAHGIRANDTRGAGAGQLREGARRGAKRRHGGRGRRRGELAVVMAAEESAGLVGGPSGRHAPPTGGLRPRQGGRHPADTGRRLHGPANSSARLVGRGCVRCWSFGRRAVVCYASGMVPDRRHGRPGVRIREEVARERGERIHRERRAISRGSRLQRGRERA